MTKKLPETENRKRERGSPRARHRRLLLTLGLAGGLAVTAAAGAATGVFSVGETIRGGEPGPPEYRMRSDETVLATGSSPIAGTWRITAYRSEASESQPAGLPCIRLVLDEPPKGTPVIGSGFCGEVGGDFSASSVAVKGSSGEAELIIFGLAPSDADAVELVPEGERTVSARTRRGPATYRRGVVWAITVQPGPRRGQIEWRDGNGKAGAKRLDASGFYDRLEVMRKLQLQQ